MQYYDTSLSEFDKKIDKDSLVGDLARFDAQQTLFCARPSRLSLLRLSLPDLPTLKPHVNVWRNHSFEPIESLASPFFLFWGWQVKFQIGGYDDSFTFTGRETADADLIWLDKTPFLSSLSYSEWLSWLESRLLNLRAHSTSPIILATWTDDVKQSIAIQSLVDSLPAVYFADLAKICDEANVALVDTRSNNLAGTPISNEAQVLLARELACHWLPGVLVSPIKAIVVDLDNTLHRGVLGEDGIDGVELTSAHADLQHYLKSLQQRGVFLALVSRNESSDVEALFKQRQDYPLRWEDFSAIEISWKDKAIAIAHIVQALRIASDAVLFVDDNPGELVGVIMQYPQIKAVYAHSDATLTRSAIHYYPGIWRWKIEDDDAGRINDMNANIERDVLAESMKDSLEYFHSLRVTLTYRYNEKQQLGRLADLCTKTNQFNLALQRFNQAELTKYIKKADGCVASVQLKDRLSDSGVIAVIVAERRGDELVVVELCVSCRALGRHLEDSIVLLAVRQMPIFSGCKSVVFQVQHGPRNQPALSWLSSLLGVSESLSPGVHSISSQALIDFTPTAGIKVSQA